MWALVRGFSVLALVALCLSDAYGQSPTWPVEAAGAPPATYSDPRAAAAALEEALARDSMDYGTNWRAAVALLDTGKQIDPTGRGRRKQDSLYRVAVRYSRRAIRLAPEGAEGHFTLAASLGHAGQTRGVRERIENAEEILAEARKAIALDPSHDGAWHVLGLWHAEIMRLNGPERFVARRLLGAASLAEANWDAAITALRRATTLRPNWIFHRLDLAEALLDLGNLEEARTELRAIASLPPIDVLDGAHKSRAIELRRKIGEGSRR